MGVREIDRRLLDTVLNKIDTTKMSCLQVVQQVYDTVYLTFKKQWLENEAEIDRLGELVVKKNMEIDRLHGQIHTLVTLCEGAGIEVPTTYKSIREQISEKIKEETR